MHKSGVIARWQSNMANIFNTRYKMGECEPKGRRETPSARKARTVLNENSRSSCENQSQQQVHFFKRYKSAKKLSKTFWNFIEHFIVFHWEVNTESASLLRQRLRGASIAAEAKYTFKLLSFISLSPATLRIIRCVFCLYIYHYSNIWPISDWFSSIRLILFLYWVLNHK